MKVLGSASVALERSVLTCARESSKPKWWYERSVLGLDCNFLKQMSQGTSLGDYDVNFNFFPLLEETAF